MNRLLGLESLPLLVLLSSLIPAIIIAFLKEPQIRLRTALNLGGASLKLVLVGLMLLGVAEGRHYEWRYEAMPGLELTLVGDPLAMLFVTLSAVLWLLTTIYAIGYLEGSPNRSRFFAFFSLCVTATVGIALAGDLFTFVVFYEALTWATYPLVVHRGTPASIRAGRTYLRYTVAGGVVLLVGVIWLRVLAGTLDFEDGGVLAHLAPDQHTELLIIFGLLVGGLGVKAALVPFHGWLPVAMVAPAPVSALLHAVAVVKAGAFGIVRVIYSVYGIELATILGGAQVLALAAGLTIVVGSLRALQQDDLKKRLAYSTVSQVSYIVLGVATIGPLATTGGLVHLVHQGLMKITLFFCAGNLAEQLNIKRVSQMAGVGRRMPLTMIAFTIGALGMIGVPPVAGFVSKWYIGLGGAAVGLDWVVWVLVASTALNAAYFLPILHKAWFEPARGPQPDPDAQTVPDPGSPTTSGGGLLVPAAGNRPGIVAPSAELVPGRDGALRTGVREMTVQAVRPPREASWLLVMPPLVTAALSLAAGLLAGMPGSPLSWAKFIVSLRYGP